MLANDRRVENSMAILRDMPESKLKQVQALQCFELCMCTLALHQYFECASAFKRMVELNSWSHGLYLFIAACCHIEMYRELKQHNPESAEDEAKKAEALLSKIPSLIGKKRIMARQMPFDVFVVRKLEKWKQRAKEYKLSIVDAAGVSPICEIMYFWNSFKRMQAPQLEATLKRLAWSTERSDIPWADEAVDEQAVLAVLHGTVLRQLGLLQKARDVLKQGVLTRDRSLLKGGYKDNWTAPAAHYENGVIYWLEFIKSGKMDYMNQSRHWLELAVEWETYDLDTRIGLRIKTGLETVKGEIKKIIT